MTVSLFLNSVNNFLNSIPTVINHFLLAIIIILFFWFTKNILTNVLLTLISRPFLKTNCQFMKEILQIFRKPLRFFWVILGLYLGTFCFSLPLSKQLLVAKLFRSILIILITWPLFNLADINSILFRKFWQKTKIEIDQVLATFLSRFLKVVLVLMAFTIFAQEWNYDINGLIAGLGLGGLALALAAKDSLANIFGGIVIILDKSFTLGDWISTNDVEGTVEEIGFRSTKIRTFTQALVAVPNSTLANEAITNWSKRGKRRLDFELSITYNTPLEKLKKGIASIKAMLEQHADIHQDNIYVNFNRFGENGFQIYIYFFTKTTAFARFLKVKEDVNFKLLQILLEEEITLAYESKTLYLHTSAKPNSPLYLEGTEND